MPVLQVISCSLVLPFTSCFFLYSAIPPYDQLIQPPSYYDHVLCLEQIESPVISLFYNLGTPTPRYYDLISRQWS